MSEAYLGQIILFAGPYEPANWMYCAGQMLQIRQYNALYAVIGTSYGGDGKLTFALPDLRSRVPVGAGQSPGLSGYRLGATGGVEAVTLTQAQMPAHVHTQAAANTVGDLANPANAYLAQPADTSGMGTSVASYVASLGTHGVTMNPACITAAGGSSPHTNMQPYQALNYIICTQGLYPQRN
ncbi:MULTISPECIES: phage tail protein [Methylobacterium]|uniref:phage tail protein n=1 Tax=Methylobacterium TaxID=407 RepID=UPI0013EBC580|nr:tail fiber protein [Methylobacterium sp. DB0501]NGM36094.1 phage tail protein [Methylobacterium sp. DB0501]